MHFFLVNDDGIGAVGITALIDAAARRGHRVSVCAPSGQQSAASQRITLNEPLYVKPYPVEHAGVTAFAITGTPADCVRLGLLGGLVSEPVDVLVSGINNGYNAGMAVHYSGTVGAALEGSFHGLKAIAASIDADASRQNLEQLADYTVRLGERYAALSVPYATILNLNAPNLPAEMWQPPVYAPLSMANFLDGYERREAERVGVYYWLKAGSLTDVPEPGSDQWYLDQGRATLTLMGNPHCEPETLLDNLGLWEGR